MFCLLEGTILHNKLSKIPLRQIDYNAITRQANCLGRRHQNKSGFGRKGQTLIETIVRHLDYGRFLDIVIKSTAKLGVVGLERGSVSERMWWSCFPDETC